MIWIVFFSLSLSLTRTQLDEYFLAPLQAIDDYCSQKKSQFSSKIKWDSAIVKCIETLCNITTTPQAQVGDLRCKVCVFFRLMLAGIE